jgi:NADP-dependent 3-hydroxy acid dehydrogenase YdfG
MAGGSNSTSRVWLITGCSSGFGQLFIPAILARHERVIATARDTNSLGELPLHHSNLRTLHLDVTASQEILDDKVAQALELFGRIDVLVNNAGYVMSGVWEEVR